MATQNVVVLGWLLRVWRELPEPLKQVYLRLRYAHFGVGLAALIRDERSRILLVRRTYSRDEPWALPGGWMELGDADLEAALQRELREETSLRVKLGKVRSVERAGFSVVVLIEAELLDPIEACRPSAEVSDVAWAEPDEVGRLSRFNARLVGRAPR